MRLLIPFFSLLTLQHLQADNAALDAWLKHQTSVTSLDAAFTQERKIPALKNLTSTPGRLYFSKPDKFRYQLGNPMETLVISDGTNLTFVDVTNKVTRSTSVNSPQAARFSLLSGKAFSSPEQFYVAFEVIADSVTQGIHQYTLKAKDRKTQTQIPWVFLDIDISKNELRAIELELQDKSRLRTIFQNPRFNSKLEDSIFKAD
jgi:outer membrane lipoprotein carrier protein